MDALGSLDSSFFIIVLSALGVLASFFAFIMPMLARAEEKRKRYKEVIERKRRTLFEEARAQANKTNQKQQAMTAAQSMATLFKLQSLAGEASVQARVQMLQAGIRDPKAPLIYLGTRIILPLFLVGFGSLVFGLSHKQISHGTIMMILVMLAAAGFFMPRVLIKNIADKRQAEISQTFPDALDMLLICVQGGIGVEPAI
jgi:tight adherence protein C